MPLARGGTTVVHRVARTISGRTELRAARSSSTILEHEAKACLGSAELNLDTTCAPPVAPARPNQPSAHAYGRLEDSSLRDVLNQTLTIE